MSYPPEETQVALTLPVSADPTIDLLAFLSEADQWKEEIRGMRATDGSAGLSTQVIVNRGTHQDEGNAAQATGCVNPIGLGTSLYDDVPGTDDSWRPIQDHGHFP
jgi:hypothetical protein